MFGSVSTSSSGPSPLPLPALLFFNGRAVDATRLASPPHHHDPTSHPRATMAWRSSPAVVTALVALLGLGLAGYIVGPPLYWHVAEALGRSPAACPACDCDCDARPLLSLPEDCSKQFKEVRGRASGEETEKSFTELLVEELKQREEEATQAQQQADVKLLEAKKLASQYQKEADKCSSGMDTCEEAREKSAEALLEQKKLTALWEERAQELGWKPGNIKPHRK